MINCVFLDFHSINKSFYCALFVMAFLVAKYLFLIKVFYGSTNNFGESQGQTQGLIEIFGSNELLVDISTISRVLFFSCLSKI